MTTPQTSPPSTDRDTHLEQWIYGGLRMARKTGTRMACWIDQTGRELYFKPIAGQHPVIGGVYEQEVKRESGSVVTKYGPGRYLHRSDDEAAIAGWEAEDRITRHDLEAAALERSAGRKSELGKALEPLLAIAAKQIDPAKREALATYVTRRMFEVPWRK